MNGETVLDVRYPTCPWCGHEEGEDLTGANDGSYITVKCSECGKEYHAEAHIAYDCMV
jgi:transcription elongation factor Elf1